MGCVMHRSVTSDFFEILHCEGVCSSSLIVICPHTFVPRWVRAAACAERTCSKFATVRNESVEIAQWLKSAASIPSDLSLLLRVTRLIPNKVAALS